LELFLTLVLAAAITAILEKELIHHQLQQLLLQLQEVVVV
jgi:hypothetical protein